ncbi:MAG: hypothetical protein ACF8GE_01400 [Phycisphaerales bacterium JB043]
MKNFARGIVAATALTVSAAATAETFNYGDLFEGIAQPGSYTGFQPDGGAFTLAGGLYDFTNAGTASTGDFESAWVSHVWTQNAITLTATAWDSSGAQIFAYGDSYSGGKPAGIGAVQPFVGTNGVTNPGFQADPGSADNASGALSEMVRIVSNIVVSSVFSFRDANHNVLDASNILVSVDGGAFVSAAGAHVGSSFLFKNGPNSREFYVQGATATGRIIPLPSVAALGGLGLIGVGARRRRGL